MQSDAVVKANNVVRNIVGCLCVVGVVLLPYPLHFQVEEETLYHGVVPTIALAAHTARKAVLLQQRLMLVAGVLRAPVIMNDQSSSPTSLNDGHLHCRQIEPAASRTNIGDVADPSLVWPLLFKSSTEHMGRHSQAMLAVGRMDNLRRQTGRKPLSRIKLRWAIAACSLRLP